MEAAVQRRSMATAQADGEQAVAAKKTRTKTLRVPESRMERILARHPTRRLSPYPNLDVLSDEPELQQQLRERLDKAQAFLRKSYDEDEAVYQQYLVKGYAEIEVEIRTYISPTEQPGVN